MGLPLQRFSYDDNSGGVDLKSSPTKVEEDQASLTLNVDYSTDGAVWTRFGSTRINSTQSDQLRTLAMYDYKKSDGTQVQVIAQGTTLKHGLSTLTTDVSGLNGSIIPDFEFQVTPDDEYLFWGNGFDTSLKFDGTTWTNWNISAPADPTVADNAVGILPAGTYSYFIAFVRYDVPSNTIQQISDLNPVKQSVTILINHSVDITRPASVDPQVNGWVIYRASPTSDGVFYQLIDGSEDPVIVPIATTTYNDNIATDGTEEASFDNQPAPNSAIFESYLGRMYIASGADLLYSEVDLPWNVPTENDAIIDGPINCLKRVYDVLLISTSNGTLWQLKGDIATNLPQRISGNIGIMNNRCADGDAQLYVFATNKKVYYFRPTDFDQGQLRINEPLSINVDPFMTTIPNSLLDKVSVKYYSTANVGKLMMSVPTASTNNDTLLIYNETQAQQKEKPCWQIWDNLNVSSMQMFNIAGDLKLYSGDFNGFIWKLDDPNTNGDGAEINGTVTSATNTSLTQLILSSTATSGAAPDILNDTNVDFTTSVVVGDYLTITGGTGVGQTVSVVTVAATQLTVNPVWGVVPDNTSTYTIGPFNPSALAGINVGLISGTGSGQVGLITTNTNTTLNVSSAWTQNPDSTTVFSVGAFTNYHFTNWKNVTGSYDTLKQLWYLISNMNAAGAYSIELIVQTDYDTSEANALILNLDLSALNAIWGSVIWASFTWGSFSVFQDLLRINEKFYAIRFGFRSKKAGQPFQLNRFGLAAQDKGLFYKV